MRKILFAVAIAFTTFTPLCGCGGTDTTEIDVTPYDASVETRMKEREAEMMSEQERRRTAQ